VDLEHLVKVIRAANQIQAPMVLAVVVLVLPPQTQQLHLQELMVVMVFLLPLLVLL